MDKKPATDRAIASRNAAPQPVATNPTHSQRVSPRATLPSRVLLKVGDTYVMARTIHDISLTGAYVEIDSAELRVGSVVDAVIEFSDAGRITDLQLSAEIVRVDEQGIGLRFNAYGDQVYTELVNLLYAR